MWPPGYSTSISQVFIIYEQCAPSFLETEKSPAVPGPDYTEDARRCPSGTALAARFVSAEQYADVHCRATEQFHARACPFGKIN